MLGVVLLSAAGAPASAAPTASAAVVGSAVSSSSGAATAPVGRLDLARGSGNTVEVRGWAADPDSRAPVDVHVYVDGRARDVLRADGPRPDVGAAFPALGAARGFAGGVPFILPGRHTVCVYAIDSDGSSPNTTLGCASVDVVDGRAPVGAVDQAFGIPGGWLVRGWAIDPDTAQPIDVHTYVDGVGAAVTTAALDRPDVGAAFPAEGPRHGFAVPLATGERARVCSYAINTAGGSGNTTLGCLTLVRPVNPVGSLDQASRADDGTARVRGWSVDPDTSAAVDVHVYVDGVPARVVRADGDRPDVGATLPLWGPRHGYDVSVPAASGAVVCAYAINTGSGTQNTTLGCRTV